MRHITLTVVPITLIIALLVFVAASGCSAVSQKLDDTTGTTLAQRCADYRGFLASAVALQEVRPTEARAERIVAYRSFISANCPE